MRYGVTPLAIVHIQLLFPLTSVVLIGALITSGARKKRRNGWILGLYAWAASLIMASLPLWVFDVNYSLKADVFVAACLAALGAAYAAVRKPESKLAIYRAPRASDWSVGRQLGWIGVAGNILLVLASIKNGVHISLSTLTGGGLEEVRKAAFETSHEASAGGIQLVGTFLAPAGYLYLVIAAKLNWRGDRGVRLLAYWNFALITIVSLFLYGGRQPIFIALLLVLTGLWLRGIKIIRVHVRTLVIGVVVLASILYFVTSFATKRQQAGTEPSYLMRVVSHAHFSPLDENAAGASTKLGGAIFQLTYLGSPLPSLSYYTQQQVPGPFYGQYSFPLLGTLSRTLYGAFTQQNFHNRWQNIRTEVFDPYESQGYLGNVWATFLRDALVDWGYVGGTLFCAAFGAFMAWARNRYEATGGVFYHALESYAALTFAFGAFQSLLYPDFVAYGFFMALVIVIGQGVASGRAVVRAERLRPIGTLDSSTGDTHPGPAVR